MAPPLGSESHGTSFPEIFRARDVHRETLAALAVFQAAAALDAATADLARDLAAYFTRARLDPELRFERER
ncbi:MAG TPA: hypothetical protein VLB76_08400 [Thermoanaerobaculia bacterium]|jgi:hypothetical protein|nr:hypothetical protein [Thermoanaerobaculia bacterium]